MDVRGSAQASAICGTGLELQMLGKAVAVSLL
jgi:hypothetical protein